MVDPIPIAAKFEDDSKGDAIAQMALEESEETNVQTLEDARGPIGIRDSAVIQRARIDDINPDACEREDDELPDTEVNHEMDSEDRAHHVIADPLTRKPGSPGGSDPTTDPEVPRGWPHVRSFDLYPDRRGRLMVTNWVKFHLLNNETMHGPGEGFNLVPAAKKDNTAYYNDFEKTMEPLLTPLSNGIYTYEITVDSYRRATAEAPYLSDFPVSLTINAKQYNDWHNDKSNTTPIFDGKTFTFKIEPQSSREPGEAARFVIMHSGEPNIKRYTSVPGDGPREIAKLSATSVDELGRKLVEQPSSNRRNFESRLEYLRGIRDSIGPFYRNGVLEANVLLFSATENMDVIREEVAQKVTEYETLLSENNHVTLRAKFDEVVEAENGLSEREVRRRIRRRFLLRSDTLSNYLDGSSKPNPLIIRNIIKYLTDDITRE